MEPKIPVVALTPNQVVAWNLREARRKEGWTQAQAAEALEPYLGEKWSTATFSAAEEGTLSGRRIRQFTADDLIAFSLAFDLPVMYFLLPPDDLDGVSPVIRIKKGAHVLSPGELIERVLNVGARSLTIIDRLRHLAYPPALLARTQKQLDEATAMPLRAAVQRMLDNLFDAQGSLEEITKRLDYGESDFDPHDIAIVDDEVEEDEKGST